MAPLPYSRIYPRFPLHYPVIIGGDSFVGEGILTGLSFRGCSVLCDQEVPYGSAVRVSVLLPDQTPALSIELGTIRWAQGHQFGMEFLRLAPEARQRLNRTLRIELIHFLNSRSGRSELPALPDQGN